MPEKTRQWYNENLQYNGQALADAFVKINMSTLKKKKYSVSDLMT